MAVSTQFPNAIARFVASLVMLGTIWPARQEDSARKMEHGVGWLQLVKVNIRCQSFVKSGKNTKLSVSKHDLLN